MKFNSAFFMLATLVALSAHAKEDEAPNMMDELDPYAADIEQQLEKMDAAYEQATGKSPFLSSPLFDMQALLGSAAGCYQRTCKVFLDVDKSRQRAQLFIDGTAVGGEWKVTTGMAGHETPNFDRSPEQPLRIYDKYSSSKYPGGDWGGFGNMPFVVFIRGGFGVHGTTGGDTWGNISKLGTKPLSHGCVRVHPNNAKTFNRLVRQHGAAQTWITVHN